MYLREITDHVLATLLVIDMQIIENILHNLSIVLIEMTKGIIRCANGSKRFHASANGNTFFAYYFLYYFCFIILAVIT